jgi:phosphomannomutase
MDDQGVYVDNTDLIALIVDYLLRVRGERGAVVKSVSTSSMVDRIARAFGVEVIESPVGFKNIASRMVQSSGLLGVEESGGFAYSPNIPDKDGLLTDMFALEMRVKEGPFHEQLLRLRSRYGELTFQRLDIPIAEARSEKAFRLAIESLPSAFQGASMLHDSSLDGYKRYFEDDSWILIRPSGTENKIRLYFESASLDVFRAMLAWAEGLKELFQSQTK